MRKREGGETPDRGELLRSVPMFEKLNEEELVQLSRIGRWNRPEAGDRLFEEGHRGAEMFVVARGKIALEKTSLEGPKFIAERGRGEILGEMALFDDCRRSATAVCRTDCLLLSVTKAEFIACVRKNPSVAMGVIANLIDRLREADTRATLATSLDVYGRLAHHLLESCRIVGDRLLVRPRPSDSAVASRIGCSRETVNRKLTEMESSGLIVREKGQIEILDEEQLQSIVGE